MSVEVLERPLGLIGCGNMGSALLQGGLARGLLDPGRLFLYDVDELRRETLARETGGRACADNAELMGEADLVLLAVKPQGMGLLLDEIAPLGEARHCFVSIAAGIPIDWLLGRLGASARVVRAMPNTPALLGCGATGLCTGGTADDADLQAALALFGAVGEAVVVEECLMNSVTAVSGSGPAYFFRMIEALAEAGCAQGLDADVAGRLAAQTALGAARMATETGEDPATLRRRVTSPGGTTEAGLKVLDQEGFGELIGRCVAGARARGEELARMLDEKNEEQ